MAFRNTGATGPRDVGIGSTIYRADELIVSLPYQRLVCDQLVNWNGNPQLAPEDQDIRLGLVRLTLDATAAVDHVRRELPEWVVQERAYAQRAGYAATDIDILLRCLRRSFAESASGWTPTMGKNRVVDRVGGSYVIDGGGKEGPRPIRNYVLSERGQGGWWKRSTSRKTVMPRGIAPGSGARVGVVDTRLFPHPWLAGGYVAVAEDLLSAEAGSEGSREVDHATFVTGLVLRQAPGAVVELRSGLDDQATQDSWALARTIATLAESADVVNLSLGCTTEDGHPPLVLSAAMAALGPRTVVVAAAGNHGNEDGLPVPKPVWPAALDNVVAVGALDGDGPASFTPDTLWVDALAPGVDVASTCEVKRRGRALFATWSGTSFASAAVAGAIAANIKDGRTPQEAWRRLQEKSRKDARGRALIPLQTLSDWPPDRVAARR